MYGNSPMPPPINKRQKPTRHAQDGTGVCCPKPPQTPPSHLSRLDRVKRFKMFGSPDDQLLDAVAGGVPLRISSLARLYSSSLIAPLPRKDSSFWRSSATLIHHLHIPKRFHATRFL